MLSEAAPLRQLIFMRRQSETKTRASGGEARAENALARL